MKSSGCQLTLLTALLLVAAISCVKEENVRLPYALAKVGIDNKDTEYFLSTVEYIDTTKKLVSLFVNYRFK